MFSIIGNMVTKNCRNYYFFFNFHMCFLPNLLLKWLLKQPLTVNILFSDTQHGEIIVGVFVIFYVMCLYTCKFTPLMITLPVNTLPKTWFSTITLGFQVGNMVRKNGRFQLSCYVFISKFIILMITLTTCKHVDHNIMLSGRQYGKKNCRNCCQICCYP